MTTHLKEDHYVPLENRSVFQKYYLRFKRNKALMFRVEDVHAKRCKELTLGTLHWSSGHFGQAHLFQRYFFTQICLDRSVAQLSAGWTIRQQVSSSHGERCLGMEQMASAVDCCHKRTTHPAFLKIAEPSRWFTSGCPVKPSQHSLPG